MDVHSARQIFVTSVAGSKPTARLLFLVRPVHEGHLARQHVLIALEDHVDPLADVNRHGDFGPLVKQFEPVGLFGRDVDGGRYFFA